MMETLFNAYDGATLLGSVWGRDLRDAKRVAAAKYPQAVALVVRLAQTKRH
jgi:hypothetical protein